MTEAEARKVAEIAMIADCVERHPDVAYRVFQELFHQWPEHKAAMLAVWNDKAVRDPYWEEWDGAEFDPLAGIEASHTLSDVSLTTEPENPATP